ncbi:MAG: NAD(P)-dependent oxidoreductase, partial [Leptospira sp.]|nr:NAD(P)-dependent oxidoreductase [Leptospira sp.]
MKKTIAIIGTGIMGRGMAVNLAKEGHQVRAYARNPKKIRDLERSHPQIRVLESIAQATNESDLTILCLTTDESVEGAFREITGTKTILDTGTTSVDLTLKMNLESKEKGIRFFDCPMTGSKLAAESGEILFMLGGASEEATEFHYFLDACGKKTIYCGGIGMGQKVKFALNMVQAGIYEVLLEGLDLAKGL